MKNLFKRLLQWVQNLTIFFLFQISQQIWLLEASKVSAEMGRGWQADWATAKIFFSNLCKHEMNKCWKIQADILIHIWFRAKRLKICCNNRPPFGKHQHQLKKFWPLLNQPASHGPFRPKLWMPLATIFVEIFEKEKNWWGSRQISVTPWKESLIC